MKKQYTAPIHLYTILLLFIWSLVIVCLAIWKINSNADTTQALAESQARAHFSKDKAFRLWLTGHGRLYIPVGDKYQPDPYLSHITDRDITTPSGIKLSLINPARIVRELGQQYKKFYGISGRVTKLLPINPDNKPDAWEKSALLQFEQGVQEVFEFTHIKGEPFLRLIQPLPLKRGCLLCHLELSGKTNDIGGGVTISIPMKEFLAQQKIDNWNDIQLFFIVWCIGAIGLPFAFFHLKRQMSDKEKAINELASSQSHNKAIMDSALDSIITINSSGIITEVNPATEKTFGYQRSNMIGYELANLIIPPALRDKHRAGIKQFLQTGKPSILGTRIETVAFHADGHEFPVELAIVQISDGDIFFTAYLRDLTEAHKLKQKLTYQATHDPLTSLMNRKAFEDHLESLLNEIEE
ncbi:MAG: PAS domain S-box protein, partial [Gammaproteobacteria bacterium]|nr:PAS domain S-box protein [Gammaproteobacteria bacterium]